MLSGMKGSVSCGPEFVELTVLTSTVVEIDLPEPFQESASRATMG